MKRQMIMLENLSCPSCAAKLEKAVQRLPGIKMAKVSFGTGSLSVEYDEGQLQEADIKAKVKQFGVGVAE
ncbi:MAG: heavy-metal-associated domain-containing protein [Limnochordia bacterium]